MGVSISANFAQVLNIPNYIKCNRSGSAYTYVNNGIESVPANTPRLVQGSGILCEPSAINLAIYCRDFTRSAWSNNTSAAVNQIGIDGAASSASELQVTTSTDFEQSITASSNTYIFSIWLKRNSTNTAAVYITINGTDYVEVNPTTDKWQRFSISATLSNPVIGIRTSGYLFADFAQLEIGTVPSSPILTTSSTATRNSDFLWIELDKLGSRGVVFNPYYGTLFTEAELFAFKNTQTLLYLCDDTLAADFVRMSVQNTGTRIKYNVGFNQSYDYQIANTDLDGTIPVANTVAIAAAYSTSQQLVAVNGVEPISPGTIQDASIDLSATNRIWLGSQGTAGSNQLFGYIRKLELNTTAITQAQLNELTFNTSTQITTL